MIAAGILYDALWGGISLMMSSRRSRSSRWSRWRIEEQLYVQSHPNIGFHLAVGDVQSAVMHAKVDNFNTCGVSSTL